MSKPRKKNPIKEIAEELDVFDDMFSTLLELLEEKGVIKQREFEDKMKKKIERTKKFRSYRRIQLDKDDRYSKAT
jgi:hypothetical protein